MRLKSNACLFHAQPLKDKQHTYSHADLKPDRSVNPSSRTGS